MLNAAPAAITAEGLGARNASAPKLVHAQAVNGLLWTVYDDESRPLLEDLVRESSKLERRCGSNNIQCDYVNWRANSPLCSMIVDLVASDWARQHFIGPHTDICMTAEELPDNEDTCCISWPVRLPDLKFSMLWGAAAPMRSRCTRDNFVSARATDVDLAGTCTVQCLSSRPDGCY
jgi:hypothetical protein